MQAALDAMDPEKRLQMEGYRPGTYVRLQFSGEAGSEMSSDHWVHRVQALLRTLMHLQMQQ